MPCRLVYSYRRFEGSQRCFHLQGQTQKTKTVCSFETSLNIHPSTQHNTTEDEYSEAPGVNSVSMICTGSVGAGALARPRIGPPRREVGQRSRAKV